MERNYLEYPAPLNLTWAKSSARDEWWLFLRALVLLFSMRKGEPMFGRLLPFWVFVSGVLVGGSARAQAPFPVDLIPTRTALERLGLERQWFGVIPLVESERLMRISMSGDRLFAQTDYAMVHAFDSESGRLLWSAQVGERTGFARGVTSNSFAVFVTNANIVHALEKQTGRPIWKQNLNTIPTSPPACDENHVAVGLTSGRVIAFNLKIRDQKGNESILRAPSQAWAWTTGGPVLTRPLPASQFFAFGSSDGKAYVVAASEWTSLYRISTGGPIGEGLGAYGTRTLLIPSGDNNLYGVDLLTSRVLWAFPSGAPIDQEPLVADSDVYTINTAGNLSVIDPNTGEPRWTSSTQGGRLAAISGTKLFLRSYNLDLFLMDRKTGRMLVDPGETHIRAGLNLREFDLDVVNRFNDRMYFATSSGLIVCMRETGHPQPRLLRDPNALPFGYVPPEGVRDTPPPAPAADTSVQPKNEPGAEEAPAAADKEKADTEKEKEPAPAPK
jgi:outer membrane protein assembly factor BamB